jgi:putative DNA primase/helicase
MSTAGTSPEEGRDRRATPDAARGQPATDNGTGRGGVHQAGPAQAGILILIDYEQDLEFIRGLVRPHGHAVHRRRAAKQLSAVADRAVVVLARDTPEDVEEAGACARIAAERGARTARACVLRGWGLAYGTLESWCAVHDLFSQLDGMAHPAADATPAGDGETVDPSPTSSPPGGDRAIGPGGRGRKKARLRRLRNDLDREPDAVIADDGGHACGPNEAIDDPHRLARTYVEKRRSHADGPTLRFHRDEKFAWDGRAYRPIPDGDLRAEVSAAVKVIFDDANRGDIEARHRDGRSGPMPVAQKVGTKLVADIMQAIASQVIIDSRIDAPAWLSDDVPWPAVETLPCRNGLIHIAGLLQGELRIEPPTPRFFATFAMPFDFDPAAAAPAEWLGFLDQLWPDDAESIATLQEWFGYTLTADTSQQKLLMLIGPKRSGKSTIGRVLRALCGPENTAGPTLSSLTSGFGLAPLINKPLAIIADARLGGRADQAIIVERILSITGEDALDVDRKYRDAWTGKLPTRLVLISNELPKLTDASGALVSRLVLLRMTRSFLGQEDTGLFGRLEQEMPGILIWALGGLARLQKRGRFVQPRSGQELLETMDDFASPVTAFVRETCTIRPGSEIPVDDLYQRWKIWCDAAGRPPGSTQVFGRDLQAAFPIISVRRPRVNGEQVRVYSGIRLTSQSERMHSV